MKSVERFFHDLTVDCVRDVSFASLGEFVAPIDAYLAQRDSEAKCCVWKAKGRDILTGRRG
jgi:hypothetical protein